MQYKKIYIDKDKLDSNFKIYLDSKGIGDDLFVLIPLISYKYESDFFDKYYSNNNSNSSDIDLAKSFFNKYFGNCFVKYLDNGKVFDINYLDIDYCSDEIGNWCYSDIINGDYVITKVNLDKHDKNIDCGFVHEYSHILFENNYGALNSYMNVEVIPILMELIYAYLNNEKDLFEYLDNSIKFMISELSNMSVLDVERSLYIDYDIYDLLDSSIHLNGYLIAYDIFNNFIGMDKKDLFFKDLNNIILGNISIDDFINKYGKSDICRINDCIIKCKV